MTYLGIEIGGTKLQVGLGDGRGVVTHLKRVAADPQAGAAGIRQQVLAATRELLTEANLSGDQIRACGIGFGGPVDDHTARTITSHQVKGWDDFPIVEWVRDELGLRAVLGNDADVAGLAEATCGAGRGCDPVFYMNVGSGIGGALILNGRIHRGTGLGAGEIGHLWVDYDLDAEPWQPREEPAWSILEHRASGWALQRRSGQPDVPTLLRAMAAGDARANTAWVAARRRIALVLTHVIALLCPQRIVIGGGVSLVAADVFLDPLRDEVARLAFQPFRDCYDIHTAALGESVVVQGALILARQRYP
jgi:glucokinase